MQPAELGKAIEEQGGLVFIGFKDSSATAGMDETGRMLVPPAIVRAEKDRLRAAVTHFEFEADDLAFVAARISSNMLPALLKNPRVEYVEPVGRWQLSSEDVPWSIERIAAPAAWSTSTGSDAIVQIIDSGIDSDHPELAPSVVGSCVPDVSGEDQYGHGTIVAGIVGALANARQSLEERRESRCGQRESRTPE